MSIKGKERFLNVLILIGVIGLLFIVGREQYKQSLPSHVRIGVDKSYSSIPFYVALEDTSRNYFALEKVEAEFIEIIGDPLQGIKEGLYDVVAVPWYSLLVSPSINGDTVKAFGGIELKSGRNLDALIVPAETKIRRYSDIKKKRLGYISDTEYLVNLLLQKMADDGITDVQRVVLQPEEVVTAFEEDKVDVMFLLDPYRGYMIYMGNPVLFEGLISYYLVPSFPYTAIVMRKEYAKKEDRLAAVRVKNAVEATLNYLSRNPEVAKKLLIDMHGWAVEGAVVSAQIRTPEFYRLAEINVKNIEMYQTELVRMGIGTCGIRPTEFLFEKIDFLKK
ncbi:MAG: ABC transporter substrate-binding protein [candidate division WOR-3 bacterium]|nr:MAG: ABC transporter substrate-binding protein [candidate division WOR-3 bacterium]